MTSKAKPVPDGFHAITPSLIVNDAVKAIEFYKNAFGAEELGRSTMPDGSKVIHAELKIGNSIFFVYDEFPEWGQNSPTTLGGNGGSLHLYVEDVDARFAKAVAAGATLIMPVTDAFWGDRYGQVADPFGHKWSIATHVKDLSREEIERASSEYFSQAAAK